MSRKEREVVAKTEDHSVVLSQREVVEQGLVAVRQTHPDIVSYDETDPESETLRLRIMVDPGVPAPQRDGWEGTVCHWGVSVQEVTDEATGEVRYLPSLALVSTDDQLLRLTGWPAIGAWLRLVGAAGADRVRAGLRVRVRRQPSRRAGRSYWVIVPTTDIRSTNGEK
jgi:hypothetical protein